MKNQSVSLRSSFRPLSLRSSLPLRTLAWRGLLVAGCLALLATPAHAQGSEMAIGVRSKIVDKPFKRIGKPTPEATEHGKRYILLPMEEVPSQQKLVKPVDTNYLAGLVVRELDSHGFTRVVSRDQKPQIMLRVYYGRGWLKNPFLADSGPETPGSMGAAGVSDAPQVSITGTGNQLFKEKSHGYEQKLQRAGYEKLFIRLTAWEFPTDTKIRPKTLWHTTMIVDDPDHRDLNNVAAEMLASGATFFGKEIAEEEVDLYKPIPEGRVKLGTPEEVETPPAKAK